MHDRRMKMVGIGVIAAVVISTAVMLLWNALLPEIFGIKSIGFFQALGLLILCKILFGGIGGRGWFGRHGREMRERWLAMSPEERESFMQQRGFGRGFGHGCRGREDHPLRHGRCGPNGRHHRGERQGTDEHHDSNDEKTAPRDKQE